MRVVITKTGKEKTNNGSLKERIGIGRICQNLVQVEERALRGFGTFGKVINLSLICCIPKEEDKGTRIC
jgi:hypothetical protein